MVKTTDNIDFKDEDEFDEEPSSLVLNTHKKINDRYSGYVHSLDDGYAEIYLEVNEDMIVDDMGLIHNGFIFSGASFAAIAAVNVENTIIIGAQTHFFTPVRINDTVIFEANTRHKAGKKRVVEVIGRVGDIKIFSGSFSVVVMNKHILSIRLEEVKIDEDNKRKEGKNG